MASSRAYVRRSRFALPALALPWSRPRSPAGAAPVPLAIDWDGYAASYDAIVWANPAYRELAERVASALDALRLPEDARVADLGCGTGTFTRMLLERAPRGTVYALDRSSEFLALLDAALGHDPAIRPLQFDMDTDDWPATGLDAVVSVHVLCHARHPSEVLGRIHEALRPGGTLIAADIGRPLILAEWSRVVFADLAQRYGKAGWGRLGFLPALGFLLQHRAAARENRKFARRQREGLVWMHTPEEFGAALQAAGFEVLECDGTAFRGIDSFAIARRPGGVR